MEWKPRTTSDLCRETLEVAACLPTYPHTAEVVEIAEDCDLHPSEVYPEIGVLFEMGVDVKEEHGYAIGAVQAKRFRRWLRSQLADSESLPSRKDRDAGWPTDEEMAESLATMEDGDADD